MQQVPVVTIFVRHSADCPHAGDEFFKRCNCWKHLRWTQGGRQYRKATKQKTRAGAERVKREVEHSYEKLGKPAEARQPMGVQQAVDTFLSSKHGQSLTGGVLKKYKRELQKFVRFCDVRGRFALAEVTPNDMVDFRSGWEQDYPSSQTRQQVQARLKSFFRYAHNLGWIAVNPAVALSPIKAEEPPTLPLTPEQYQTLLNKIPEVFSDSVKAARVHAFVRCMRFTALSIRDTTCLPKERIVYDKAKKVTKVLTYRQKTGAYVGVAVPPDVAQELAAVPNDSPKYVFWNTGNGKPSTAVSHWQDDLRELFRAVGMPEGHPHQLRDTAAVEWLNAGLDIMDVSKLLGHSSVAITEKSYAPWVKSRQDRLDDKVMATWNKA